MAFDHSLAARIRDALARCKNVEEKKMFGCICFFINGNALAGVWKDRLIARLGQEEGEAALREPHVRVYGRPRAWRNTCRNPNRSKWSIRNMETSTSSPRTAAGRPRPGLTTTSSSRSIRKPWSNC